MSNGMDTKLVNVFLSHINDLKYEVGIVKTIENGETKEEMFDTINTRLDFLSHLSLKFLRGNSNPYIYPETELKKMVNKNNPR